MKALFNRTFHRSSLKDKDGSAAATAHAAAASVTAKEKIPTLPPLPEWPPPHRSPSSASQTSLKPLPELAVRPLPPIQDIPVTPGAGTDPVPSSDVTRPKPRGPPNATNSTDTQKKVAFLSPPSTPAPTVPLPEMNDRKATSAPPDAVNKTTMARLQAAEIRSSTPNAAFPKPNSGNNPLAKGGSLSTRVAATRGLATPSRFQDSTASVRSGTPLSTQSVNSSRILANASWSEAAEEDLVTNLGSRERTRQEVLWEIVASEERYVVELIKLKDTFIDPLLHPFATSPVSTPTLPEGEEYYSTRMAASPQESLEHLPIAARFLSPLSFDGPPTLPLLNQGSATPVIDGDSLDSDEEERKGHIQEAAAKLDHPRSPYRARNGVSRRGKVLPFPSRSHHSLPPPPRPDDHSGSTTSLGRQSYVGPSPSGGGMAPAQRMFRKLKKSQTRPSGIPVADAIAPHLLPENLRRCLEVIESGILNGHLMLSESLRKRYDDQYPLVRSLADIFVSNSHILREYATYVLHLERALEQVDDALTMANVTKRPKKQTEADWLKFSKYLQQLEETAADKGETGIAISLSKPFQRLLKYPLLFQNLLFHTDPSTFEYESTLQMVAEVEVIVRSIEDDKIQQEERDRTRDVFARIEGLDKVKQLAVPKPSRMLVEEKMVSEVNRESGGSPLSKPSTPPSASKNVKGKSSFRRLSDVLQTTSSNGIGGKKDLWLVVFNDVVLRCQRTGTTSLPLASTTSSPRANSLPDMQGNKKFVTANRRNSSTKPRNLYKFIKIETWAMAGDDSKPRGIVSMEDISRTRALSATGAPTTTPEKPTPEEEEEGDVAFDSDDSDRKSKMSFSYWGADKITLSPGGTASAKPRSSLGRTSVRGRATGPSSYTSRESSANAKFGTRLVHSPDSSPSSIRPNSRKASHTSSTRRTQTSTEDAKSTTTSSKPAWDASTRATSSSSTGTRRPRNISQTSSGQPVRGTKLSSLASDDSGVGLYRQMLAQDPSLNQ